MIVNICHVIIFRDCESETTKGKSNGDESIKDVLNKSQ